jgi:lipoprotein-releasing system permease protein
VRYEAFISARYLKSTRKTFLSTITVISTLGVVLGVTALTAVVSVTGGFQKAYRERVLGVYPHIMLLPTSTRFPEYRDVIEVAESVPGVASANAFVRQPAMLYTADSRSMVVVRGVEVRELLEDGEMEQYVLEGDLGDLVWDPARAEGSGDDALPGLFLGAELARSLRAEVGTRVTVVSHLRGIGVGLGPSQMAPTDAHFRVAGIFEVGYDDFDSQLALTDLPALQSVINRGDVATGVDVRLDDIFATAATGRELVGRLPAGSFQALGWQEIHRNLFRSLAIQKLALSLVMTFIVVVASFNIVSTLIMMVIDKTKEIAILKSIGATSRSIMRIFMMQGLAIGVVGTALGLVGGVVVCKLVERLNFGLDPTVYKISNLPVDMRLSEFIMVALVAVAISFVATIYPSWRAGRLNPVEGLRYD